MQHNRNSGDTEEYIKYKYMIKMSCQFNMKRKVVRRDVTKTSKPTKPYYVRKKYYEEN